MGEAEDPVRDAAGDKDADGAAVAGEAPSGTAGVVPGSGGGGGPDDEAAGRGAPGDGSAGEKSPCGARTGDKTADDAPAGAPADAPDPVASLPEVLPWLPAWLPGQRVPGAADDEAASGPADGDGAATGTAAPSGKPSDEPGGERSGKPAADPAADPVPARPPRRRSPINPWIAGVAASLLAVAGGAFVQSPFAMVSARQVPTSDLPRLSDPAPPADAAPVNGGSPADLAPPPVLPAAAPGVPSIPVGPQPIPSLTPQGVPAPQGAGAYGIPQTVLAAYQQSAATLSRLDPGCRLPWELLAGIGKVESGHAGGGNVGADGTTLTPIRGPRLDGRQFALIRDTDGGRYDGDAEFDRAVGPMQFIPSTWKGWGMDANRDGRADPQNIFDATLSAGRYLCAGDRDLSRPAGLEAAILSYNRSREYLRTVLSWMTFYRTGVRSVPDATRPPQPPPATQTPVRTTPPATSRPPTTSAPASPRPSGGTGTGTRPATAVTTGGSPVASTG